MSPLRAPRSKQHHQPGSTLTGAAAPRCPRPGGSGGAQGRLSRPGSANICGHVRRTSPSSLRAPRSLQSCHPAPLSGPGAAAGSSHSASRTLLQLPRCHLSPPEMTVTVAFLLLSLLRMAAAKGSWCPACGVAALAPGTQRDALLALAKQSILAKLRLPARPNVPQPPSRGALLTALRRMRAQRSDAAAAFPEMLRDGRVPPRPGMGLQEYEILSFAESGACGSAS